jgi:NAD(P)-dependent dehydrogenase (short-subunit alcohol dehydrogenase family)
LPIDAAKVLFLRGRLYASVKVIFSKMFNHTCLVTGSSRGIGLGLVRELISQGHTVIATCRNPETAFELRQVLADCGQPEPIECDVTSDESVLRCSEAVSLSGFF